MNISFSQNNNAQAYEYNASPLIILYIISYYTQGLANRMVSKMSCLLHFMPQVPKHHWILILKDNAKSAKTLKISNDTCTAMQRKSMITVLASSYLLWQSLCSGNGSDIQCKSLVHVVIMGGSHLKMALWIILWI